LTPSAVDAVVEGSPVISFFVKVVEEIVVAAASSAECSKAYGGIVFASSITNTCFCVE
jgi:hypothetical protein